MPRGLRTIVYVDGFNLYYGAVKGTPHKWLDLQRFFALLRPDDVIEKIRYFSALIDGPHRVHQEAYLSALKTCPCVEITLGKFKTKRVECRNPHCLTPGRRFFEMQEEKRTDVNIAVFMLDDAYQDRCEQLILVSGDSDLVPPVQMIKCRFNAKRIGVYVPHRHLAGSFRGFAVELRKTAHFNRALPLNLLPVAQFPRTIPDGLGGIISKPAAW